MAFPQALNKNIVSYIKSNEVSTHVNKLFAQLNSSLTKIEFEKLFAEFKNYLMHNCFNFYCYFERNYSNKTEHWALCNRKQLDINVNMFCESFHNIFKRSIFKGKRKNRLDTVLHALIKYDVIKWREFRI